MKQRIAKNFWIVSLSLFFSLLATTCVIARDLSKQAEHVDVNSLSKKVFGETVSNESVNADAALPVLFRGDLSPANRAYTISRSGTYKLTSAKTASGVPNITITANNVSLDLGGNTLTGGTNGIEITGNNVEIQNGTIKDMTQNGVLVQGSGCRVNTCDFVSCVTGITLQNANECVVENCHVLNPAQAGISLVTSFTNTVRDCSVTGVAGTGDVYGCVAANGGNNIFDTCLVRDVGTTGASINPTYATVGLYSAVGAGIAFRGTEHASQIIDSFCQSIEATTTLVTQAYGIGLLPTFLTPANTLTPITYSTYAGATVNTVAWLSVGGKKYLASGENGDNFSNNIKIYEFDEATNNVLSVTQSVYGGGKVRSVAWLVAQNTIYLAVDGGESLYVSNRIKIYEFNPVVGSLLLVAQTFFSQDEFYSVTWLTTGNKTYLAAGLDPLISFTHSVYIYDFQAATESLVSLTQGPGTFANVYSTAWLVANDRTYLATGEASRVVVYEFDPAFNTLTPIAQTSDVTSQAVSLSWLVIGNKNYLALGESSAAANEIKIYDFNPVAGSLATVVSRPDPENASVTSVAWLVSGNKKYLATGTNGTNELKVYLFDEGASSLTTVTISSAPKGAVNAVAWLNIEGKNYVATGGAGSDEVAILQLTGEQEPYPVECVITNNSVQSVHSFRREIAVLGETTNGIGLSISTTGEYVQYIAQNTVKDSDITFAGVPTQYITSQANTRGVYNIDITLTTSDTVPLIVDQTYTIESKLDSLLQDSGSIESKLDYLMACDYDALPAPITLSTDYGAYCLSADMSGDLAITGSGITLCLNGHTISGGTNGILVSGDEIIIKNGTVRNASASGIKITGDKCTLQDITAVGNVTGFELNGADNCTVTHCQALDSTREGFLLTNAQKNYFEGCEALNTSGIGVIAGFKTTSGVGNSFVDCRVNGVTSSNTNAFGVLAQGESKAQFDNCSIMNVTTTCYGAGIALIGDYLATPTVNDFVFFDAGRFSRLPNWLNTPVGSYLTMGGLGNYKIIKFSPTATTSLDALTTVTVTPNMSSSARSSAWLSWHNKQYLAVSGDNDAGDDIVIYDFNLASGTLATAASYPHHATNSVDGCDWVVSDTLAYLIYTADTSTSNEITALRFNGNSLVKTSGLEYASSLLSVRSHVYKGKNRLFVTVYNTDPDILVYGFNDIHGSELLEKLPAVYTIAGGFAEISTPFDFDGETYVAFGVVTGVSPTVRVLKYTENPTSQFELFATYDYGPSVAAFTVDALVTGTTVYLAVGGNKAGEYTKILTFDPYQPTVTTRIQPFYNLSAEASPANYYTSGVSWNRCSGVDNKIFLAAAKEIVALQPCLHIFGFTLNNQSQLNLVSDCMLSGVPAGDGVLLDEVINAAYDNTAYNCQEGFVSGVRTDYTVPQFATSNREVS